MTQLFKAGDIVQLHNKFYVFVKQFKCDLAYALPISNTHRCNNSIHLVIPKNIRHAGLVCLQNPKLIKINNVTSVGKLNDLLTTYMMKKVKFV